MLNGAVSEHDILGNQAKGINAARKKDRAQFRKMIAQPSRRPKLRLPNLEKRPLNDPMLPIVEAVADTDPDKLVTGTPEPLMKELCGEISSMSLLMVSLGLDATPLTP